jgi:integrase
MGNLLRGLLREWRVASPRRDGELHRVFPGPGNLQPWPLPRIGGDGPLVCTENLSSGVVVVKSAKDGV